MDIELAEKEDKTQACSGNSLAQPEPELLKCVPGNLLRPDLSVKSSLTGPDVGLGRVDELAALEYLPKSVQENEDGNTDVGSEEGGKLVGTPSTLGLSEDLEAVEDDDQSEVDESNPGGVGLPLALKDQGVAVDTLGDQCLTEAGVGVADSAPGEKLGDGGQVLEPQEDGVGASGDTHVGEQTDGSSDEHAVQWDTGLGTLQQDLGSLTVLSKSEQVTRAGVQEGVTRRSRRSQDDGVDDVGQDWDTGVLHGDDPWGALSTLGVVVSKSGIVAGDSDTDHEGTEDVEEQDTPEDTTDSLGDVLARVGGFTSGDSDHLDTTVRESGVDKGGPETGEATSRSSTDVLLHRTFLPIPEAAAVVIRGTTKHDDESNDEQTKNRDDLDRCKDELGLAIDADGEDV